LLFGDNCPRYQLETEDYFGYPLAGKKREQILSIIFRATETGLKPEELNLIVEKLVRGSLIVYPTETFYGLGGLVSSAATADRIFKLKGRESDKPLPFVASDIEMILKLVEEPSPVFFKLVDSFWPGPLTLVLKAARKALPEEFLGPDGTIAVRVPPVEWLRLLIRKAGCLLVSTSANLSGELPLASFEGVLKVFQDKVDLMIDGGRTPGGKPSTIIDLTSPEPVCLREGQIALPEIWKILAEK
jgi:L-threonylcarbamoyladenylate synthase